MLKALTIEDCDAQLTMLWVRLSSDGVRREAVLKEIDTWLDTRNSLVREQQEPSANERLAANVR